MNGMLSVTSRTVTNYEEAGAPVSQTAALADALQVPEVRALAYAAKAVMHDMRHGNGLEGLWANRDRLGSALRAIGEGEA